MFLNEDPNDPFGLNENNIVVFDTETTGLGPTAEICQLSILNYKGESIFTNYIRPNDPISDEAIAIHGITNEKVKFCKPICYYWDFIVKNLMYNKVVLGYNVFYDVRMLHQSISRYQHKSDFTPLVVIDVMLLASRDMKDSGWVRLSRATEHYGFEIPEDIGTFHDARFDAYCTLQVFKSLRTK